MTLYNSCCVYSDCTAPAQFVGSKTTCATGAEMLSLGDISADDNMATRLSPQGCYYYPGTRDTSAVSISWHLISGMKSRTSTVEERSLCAP